MKPRGLLALFLTVLLLCFLSTGLGRALGAEKVQRSAVAGSWYPADADSLRSMVDRLLGEVPIQPLPEVVALVSPHAGFIYSGKCAAVGYSAARGRALDRAIIIAPSHHVPFEGAAIPDFDYYETPLGRIPIDKEACSRLGASGAARNVPGAYAQEWAIEAQIPFLQRAFNSIKIVPIVLGQVSEQSCLAIAEAIRSIVDQNTLLVASSDFTHHGPSHGYVKFRENVQENLRKLDGGAIEEIVKLSAPGFHSYVDRTGATICGRNPIWLTLKVLEPQKAQLSGRLLSYYNSGELTGDWRNCVSYASIAIMRLMREEEPLHAPETSRVEPSPDASRIEQRSVNPSDNPSAGAGGRRMLSEQARKTLLEIARKSLEAALRGQPPPQISAADPELQGHCGVFVTLKKNGELRGCLGRFTSDIPLWRLVMMMTAASAREDYRFLGYQLQPKDLPQVQIDISVLSPLERIKDPLDFELGIHGVYIVKKGHGAGCFLPQVATETGWSKEQFLSQCCAGKAGLDPDAWKSKDIEVYRFSAEIVAEGEE